MADRNVSLILLWLLLLWLISQLVYAAAPTVLALWRDQTSAVEARVRLLLDTPLLPEPSVWELLRPASGRHRKRRLSRLRIEVAS